MDLLNLEYDTLLSSGDVRAQSYNEHTILRSHNDPVMNYVLRLEYIKRCLKELRKRTLPVKNLIADYIKNNRKGELDILLYIFIGGNDIADTSEFLKVSCRTIYRRKKKVLDDMIEFIITC